MRAQCVLADVIDTSPPLSYDFDTLAPNFKYTLGTNMQFKWLAKQQPMRCDYYPKINIKEGNHILTF